MPKPDFINNDVYAQLYSQLLHFPKAKYDDCLDALAYVNDLAQYRPAKKELSEIEKRIQERIKKDRKKNMSNPYNL